MSDAIDEDEVQGQVKIDIFKLIALGVMLCFGDPILKAKVIYNVIQVNLGEYIALNDRMEMIF